MAEIFHATAQRELRRKEELESSLRPLFSLRSGVKRRKLPTTALLDLNQHSGGPENATTTAVLYLPAAHSCARTRSQRNRPASNEARRHDALPQRQRSADLAGRPWVAYVVGTTDAKDDKSSSHVWMVNIDGSNDRQITFSNESESSPRWSPDGKYISFTSSRSGKARGNQVWLLDRNGGEAMQITEPKAALQGHEWSPDSKRLALVIGDPDPESDPGPSPQPGATPRVPKPIVIDRYRFKQDGQGYLLTGRHTYIYIFDIATKKLERLTKSKWDELAGMVA